MVRELRSHKPLSMAKKKINQDFPGGPVFKTPCFQHRGHGFNPWLEDKDPTCHRVQPKKKEFTINKAYTFLLLEIKVIQFLKIQER